MLDIKVENISAEEKVKILNEIKAVCAQCTNCILHKERNNSVFCDGNPNAEIMLIGEAPGANEDARGIPFVGRAGQLLDEFLEEAGISRKKDMYICNTVKCRPPENRVPTDDEKHICENYLFEQIKIVNPKVIVLCGATSAKSFLGNKLKITQARGQWYKILDNIDATVILHPSYLLRKHSEDEGSPRWLTKQDLKKIKEFISK